MTRLASAPSERLPKVQACEARVRSGIGRVECNGLLEIRDRHLWAAVATQQYRIASPEEELICRDVARLMPCVRSRRFGRADAHAELTDDRASDVVVDREDVAQFAIVGLGPACFTIACVHEPNADAQVGAALLNVALEHL